MNLLFTGTGAADYESVFKCPCDHCTAIRTRGGRNLRHHASLLINDALLIDCGPTVAWRLAELEVLPAQVEALVLTHSHEDHLDLPAIRALIQARADRPLPVYANSACLAALEGLAGLQLHHVRALDTIEVAGLRLTPVAANHVAVAGEETLNWIVGEGENELLYATDTGWPLQPTWEALRTRHFAGVVAEATFGLLAAADHPGYMAHHLNWDGFLRLREELLAGRMIAARTPFIATHISLHHVPPHDDFARRAHDPVRVAYDGMCVNL